MDTTIRLIGAATYTEDAAGIRRPVPAEPREIFAQKKEVTRAEFYNAGRAGYKPEFVFDVFAADYHGESVLEYENETYAIYRTYRRGRDDGSDYMELYAERQAGTDGRQPAQTQEGANDGEANGA